MRIPSGNTSTFVYFEAKDATDLTTAENGLASKMYAKYSRNGGALTDFTTPTINATDTGTGGYEILVDEGTTLDAGFHTQEYRLRIRDTGGHMYPAVRVVELFRPATDTGDELLRMANENDTGRLDVAAAATVDTGQVNQAVWQADASRALTSFDVDTGLRALIADIDTGIRSHIDHSDTGVKDALGDTGSRREIARTIFERPDVDGVKFIEAIRAITAATAGTLSGAGTGTETFVGLDDSTTRLVATVDSSGNRSAITRTLDTA